MAITRREGQRKKKKEKNEGKRVRLGGLVKKEVGGGASGREFLVAGRGGESGSK